MIALAMRHYETYRIFKSIHSTNGELIADESTERLHLTEYTTRQQEIVRIKKFYEFSSSNLYSMISCFPAALIRSRTPDNAIRKLLNYRKTLIC